MSVLIKALASAAKEKQAQLAKRQAAELASSLALAYQESQPLLAESAALTAEDSLEPERSVVELSLEEESGFSRADLSATKFPPNVRPLAATEETPLRLLGADGAQAAPFITSTAADQAAAAKAFVKYQPQATSKYALIGLVLAGSVPLMFALYAYIGDRSVSDRVQLTPAAALHSPRAHESAALPVVAEMTAANEPATAGVTAMAHQASSDNVDALAVNAPVAQHNQGGAAHAGLEQAAAHADAADGASTVSRVDLTRPQRLVQLVTKPPVATVDPALLSAYQAFNRGEDSAAQLQYRQLLKQDVRNVDALLGMAAIAQRQGRDADAIGWYQALLAIEPRNMHAQSALLSLQPMIDAVATGSRIKSMLVQQPESASLHAALGHVYAAQLQWSAAQAAYFNASQFAPDNADYVFNLAISLDQLGKSKLALEQYQRSLDLINSSGARSPDRAQLESRMYALQAVVEAQADVRP